MILPILMLIILLVPVIGANAVSRVVYKTLEKAERPNAKVIRIVTMIGSYIIILAVILALIYFNVSFER